MAKLVEKISDYVDNQIIVTELNDVPKIKKAYSKKCDMGFYRSHFFNVEILSELLRFIKKKNLDLNRVGLCFLKGDQKQINLKISYIEGGKIKHALIAHLSRDYVLKEFKDVKK